MALEDLTLYEPAIVAAEKAKEDAGLALVAMREYYDSKGISNEPLIRRGLENATLGVKSGYGLSDAGVVESMLTHVNDYQETFEKMKVSELVQYLTEGYDIPDEAKNALEGFADKTYKELKELAKSENAEDAKKAVTSMELLRGRRIEAASLKILNNYTNKQLAELYKPKEEKKSA